MSTICLAKCYSDLWDLFQLEDNEENDQCVPGQDCNGHLFMAVS
jgi:hypothetical protein